MTTEQAVRQADLWISLTEDDNHHQQKAAMNTSGWTLDPIFGHNGGKWTTPDLEGWDIYQQPAGFYVWNRFVFAGEFPTLDEAVALVETRRSGERVLMQTATRTVTTHTITLDESEQFDVTTQTRRPKNVSIKSVKATNEMSGRWDLELFGSQIRQDGTDGHSVRVSLWVFCEGMEFKAEDRAKLWAVLPAAVKEKLTEMGVVS